MTVVRFNQYDITGGLMAQHSAKTFGRQIEAIWAVGVVLFDREYYFAQGICADAPGMTPYGIPTKYQDLEWTTVQKEYFEKGILSELAPRFRKYHPLKCNTVHFALEVWKQLFHTEDGFPKSLMYLP